MIGQVPLPLIDRQTLLRQPLLRRVQIGIRSRPLGLEPLRPFDTSLGQFEQLTLLLQGGLVPRVAQAFALY